LNAPRARSPPATKTRLNVLGTRELGRRTAGRAALGQKKLERAIAFRLHDRLAHAAGSLRRGHARLQRRREREVEEEEDGRALGGSESE